MISVDCIMNALEHCKVRLLFFYTPCITAVVVLIMCVSKHIELKKSAFSVINEIIIDECVEVRRPVNEVQVPDDLNCEDGQGQKITEKIILFVVFFKIRLCQLSS